MNFQHANRLILTETKKRALTGQYSDTFGDKFFSFLRFVLLCAFTCFIGGVLLIAFRKRRFHPMVFARGSSQEIDAKTVADLLARASYSFDADEDAQILIKTGSDNFVLFSDKHVFYQLHEKAKAFGQKTMFGKLPLSKAADIKLKNQMSSAEIMMQGEVIGTLYSGESPRIGRLLKAISKDVREAQYAA